MHTALQVALFLGALILGLAFLAILRSHAIDPVGKIAGFFAMPAAAPLTTGT
jgi:hypothetical protein